MKKLKKLLCTALVVLTSLTSAPLQGIAETDWNFVNLFSINSYAASDSGSCGKNAKWKYDSKTKTLTIYGKGEMGDAEFEGMYHHGYHNLIKEDIEHVIISEGITYVGDYAFSMCCEETQIKSIKLPESVTEIGAGAFYNSKIKELNLPKNLKKIGEGAFSGSQNLKKLTIPDSVKTIEIDAFGYCTSLEKAVIGSGLKFLDYIFGGCEKLSTIVIGKNVKYIVNDFWYGSKLVVDKDNKYFSDDENGVLYNKDKTKLYIYPGMLNLETFTVPSNVKVISANSFSGCGNLKKVIATDVETIGVSAFEHTDIEVVVLGNKLKTIKALAFATCRKLKTVNIPASVTKIGVQAFYESAAVNVDSNNKKFCSDKYGVLYNKNKTVLISYPEKLQIKSYVIPETVQKIALRAFSGNEIVENVTFPKKLKEIGEFAFACCYGLESVYLYKNIEIIGEDAFLGCDLTDLVIEEGSEAKLCDGAFQYADVSEKLYVSSKITDVGSDVFDSFNIEKNGACYVGHILCRVYSDDEELKIKEGTTVIADNAFEYSKIKKLTIPASLKYIGEDALSDTAQLRKITVDKNNKYFVVENDTLFDKAKTRLIKYASESKRTEYKVPGSVKTIDEYAFYSGSSLKKIDIGSNVEYIDITMFEGTEAKKALEKAGYYYKNQAIGYMGSKVITIKNGTKSAFIYDDFCNPTEAMYIPKSVKVLSSVPFNVYYEGSEEDFKKIKLVGDLPNYVQNVNINYNFNVKSHKHVYYESTEEVTKCFSPMITTYTCPCGHSYQKENALYRRHIYCEKYNVTEKATVKNDGVLYNVCESCGKNFDKYTIAKIASVKLSYKNTKYNGKVKTPKVIVTDSNGYELTEGSDYTVKYQSGRKEVGTYNVKVTFKGFYSGSKTLKFNIVSA